MDYIDGRRGKRKVKRSCRSSPAENIPLRNDLLERFVPVTLLRSLSDMTCTLKNKDSDTGSPSTCTYHRCESCPAAFCSEEEYEQHTRIEHPAQAPPPTEEKIRPSRSSTLTCRTCKYTAPDPNKAALHEKLHRDQKLGVAVFKCKACKFLSCSKMGITIHKRLEHAPLKYECPMCNYSSFNARHVTAHVDKVHCNPEQENWGCPYCSAELDTGLKLKLHLQNEHIDESQFKEFTCDLCDYTCFTNTDIVHHMKAHRAKKKLFKCQKCLFISVKFDKYAKHLDLVHGQIETEELETEECHKEELVPPKQEEKGNIPVIRVIQKKEPECRPPPPEADEVDINNVMYTPPTSPVIKSDPVVKSDPGNIFDKMSLKNQEKAKVCRAVGLRASPRKKPRNADSKTGRLLKLRNSSQGLNGRRTGRSLKRCRYCTTKTMFDTLTKLREHHIKAHGINELGVQLGLRQYRCKYCPEKPEFEGLQALKDHYSECHPDASVRRLVKRSKSFQDESTQSTGFETSEIAKVKPSLIDEIEIAETSCETKRQDMLDCILQSQKQIGKALKDSSPECNLSQSVAKSRIAIGRINSAPSTIYDDPPTVKPVIFSSEERVPHKNTVSSAPITPHIPSARQDNISSCSTDKIIPDYQHIVGNSIYNLSLSELQYLQQQYYIYQAYCLNMYYNDPVYRQYVQEKQQEILLQHGRKVREVPDPVPDRTYTPQTQRPIVKISDPRSLAQPSSAHQPTVGLELTKPKLGSPRNPTPQPATAHTNTRIQHRCLVAACPYTTNRLLDLKKHISVEHNVRITETMEAQLEELIRAQEGTGPQEERRAPEKVVPAMANHSYPCSHCSLKLGSFDAYVQHMIEVHRNELGIISQGSMPNTFNTHYTGPPKTAVSNSTVNNTTSPSVTISTTPPTVTIKSDPQSSNTPCAEPGSSSSSVNGSASGGFECTSCYHVAQSPEALKRHEKVHSNTYHKCSVCEYIAPSEGTLQVHMNIHKS